MRADVARWLPWSSKPVGGVTSLAGGFDSHALSEFPCTEGFASSRLLIFTAEDRRVKQNRIKIKGKPDCPLAATYI